MELRNRIENGEEKKRLAEEYGVSRQTLCQVLNCDSNYLTRI
ncbi:MAG: helix-turn-helix domain-containing protein [Pseudodesulfovibrio sp.]